MKRNTIQRQLVIAAVRFLADHPTADEVYERITMEYPDISKGTVYRNLNSLVESGLLNKVSVPSGADRFDHMLTKHYHIKCSHCGKFMNVENMDYMEDLDEKVAAVTGFKCRAMILSLMDCAPIARSLRQKTHNKCSSTNKIYFMEV